MNTTLLEERLRAEGCHQFLINNLGDDVFCLIQAGNTWQVVYAERGFVRKVLFESASEAEACEAMFAQIMRIRHDHMVGFFQTQAAAEALSAVLAELGIAHHTNVLPSSLHGAARFRVFVYGKSIFAVQQRFRTLPLTNWPPTD